MPVSETSEREQIKTLLDADRFSFLEALEESALGVDGLVSVFADQEEPVNFVSVRWAQADLGLRSYARLHARRVHGLSELVTALPKDRGELELSAPFWASFAVAQGTNAEVRGAEAIYTVDADRLKPSPVTRQCMRVEDLSVFRSKFRKLSKDAPAYVLSLEGQLTSVAVATHLWDSAARITVWTIEQARGRGFGRGVLTALSEELLARRIVPSVVIDLGREPEVRMIESAGFVQHSAWMRTRLTLMKKPPDLVTLPGRR